MIASISHTSECLQLVLDFVFLTNIHVNIQRRIEEKADIFRANVNFQHEHNDADQIHTNLELEKLSIEEKELTTKSNFSVRKLGNRG